MLLWRQGALEEKKSVLEETKKAERLAMETFQEKAAFLRFMKRYLMEKLWTNTKSH